MNDKLASALSFVWPKALVGALALGASVAAHSEVEISANVTLASDYSFRGVSQTTRDPAIQGGFDVAWDNGLYIGTWSSNVNFGITSQELDAYIGYAGQITDDVGFDVSYIRYEYPGARSELSYNELAASVSWGDFTFGLGYSNEYFNLDSVSWWYPNVAYALSLPYDASLEFYVGWSLVDDNSAGDWVDAFGDEEVLDWSVTYTIPFRGIDLGLAVVGTDVSKSDCFGGSKDCSTRAIVSLSKSL
jgi:uncharacterized protein (TIGR02001 family)